MDVRIWVTLKGLVCREVELGQPGHIEDIVEVGGSNVHYPLDGVDFGYTAHRHLAVIDKDPQPTPIDHTPYLPDSGLCSNRALLRSVINILGCSCAKLS